MKSLGWESLSDRRWLRRLCQPDKIQNELTPSYLKKPIPQPRMFFYGQRLENVLHEIPCRTSKFLNSFYRDTIRSWNNIGYEFRNCVLLANLSQNYSTSSVPPKFVIHNPCGIKILFQLRVGLSPLKGQLKNHNFLDTPKFHNVYDYTIEQHPWQVSENHKPRVHPSHAREIG